MGEIAEGGIDQHAVVGGFDDGGFFRVAQSIQNCFARDVGGIVPGEGDEVFEEEFADHRCVAAFAGADDFQADCAGVHVPTAALHAGDKELFAEAGDFGEQLAQSGAGDAKEARVAAGEAGDVHGAAGEEVDVAGELADGVGDDVAVAVGGVDDVDAAGLDDEEIEIALAGVEDGLAILEGARLGECAERGEVGGIQMGVAGGVCGRD